MADNYKDTIYRMYESSDILYEKNQYFNANYLAGYVLECYCKLVLTYALQCGENISKTSIIGYSHNIKKMRQDIDLIMLNGGTVSPYCIDICKECKTLLYNWNPSKRYESNTHVLNNSVLAIDIHEEIEQIINIIIKMEIDGVI